MEQREDYLETQIDILSQLLRKLLEKLLKTKSFHNHDIISEKIALSQNAELADLTLTDLEAIEDALLVSILMNEYDYNEENLKWLADILYEVALHNEEKSKALTRKALILYEHYVTSRRSAIHLSVFNHIQKLKS